MEEEDVDIAAAMGFASFGGTKKRKFDHTNSPKAAKVESSGANTTKLGMRTKKVASADEEVFENPESEASLEKAQYQPHPSVSNTKTTHEAPAALGLAAFLPRGQTLPEKPPVSENTSMTPLQDDPYTTEIVSFGGPPISRAELNALRFGVHNENGDTAYFLSSFLEDPWEKLKKSGGT